MSKKKKIVGGIIAAVVIVIAVGAYFMANNAGTKVDTAQVKTESLAVTVMGSGKVTAGLKVDVYPDNAGLIEKVYVKDGKTVDEGDKVIKLQTDALDAQLASAKSALAQAQSGLDTANYSASTKSASIDAAKAGKNAAQVAYDAAVSTKKAAATAQARAKAALASVSKATNPAAYATALKTYESAKAAYSQAKVGVAQAKSAVAQANVGYQQAIKSPTAGAQRSAQEAVAAAQKSVNIARRAINKATIKAPMTGTVMYPSGASAASAALGAAATSAVASPNDNTPSKGAAVSQGAPVFSIVDDKAMSFTAEIDEADIQKIKVGQLVSVTLDAFTGKTFAGKVINVGSVAQSTATGGTVFLVEMSLNQKGSDLKLGMKGDCTIQVEKVASALTIPIEALFSEGGKDYVYTIENDKLAKTSVTAGTTTDTSVEILDGLREGETIALAGSTPLSNGMAVKVDNPTTQKK